ncbi:MAG: hypothetical protein IT324_04260 [Anaerolineae bacterium]|nr:hypothetical protein [Anaerolineae bacterium]
MRVLLIRTVQLIVVTGLLVVGVRIVGTINPSPTTALFESWTCSPEPCWHGIHPGETTFNQALKLLADDGTLISSQDHSSSVLCWKMDSAVQMVCVGQIGDTLNSPIEYMFMDMRRDLTALRLGEAVHLFGQPIGARLCWWQSGLDFNRPTPALVADVYFPNGVYVAAYDPQHPTRWQFDPDMAVFSMEYAPGREYRSVPDWRGFITQDDEEGCGR